MYTYPSPLQSRAFRWLQHEHRGYTPELEGPTGARRLDPHTTAAPMKTRAQDYRTGHFPSCTHHAIDRPACHDDTPRSDNRHAPYPSQVPTTIPPPPQAGGTDVDRSLPGGGPKYGALRLPKPSLPVTESDQTDEPPDLSVREPLESKPPLDDLQFLFYFIFFPKRRTELRRDTVTSIPVGDGPASRAGHRPLGVEAADRRVLGAVEIRLVSEELADVGDTVLDHRRPLQAQAPSDYPDILSGVEGGDEGKR